jgi:hypothetical protein
MQLLKTNLLLTFMGKRNIAMIFSAILLLVAVGSIRDPWFEFGYRFYWRHTD